MASNILDFCSVSKPQKPVLIFVTGETTTTEHCLVLLDISDDRGKVHGKVLECVNVTRRTKETLAMNVQPNTSWNHRMTHTLSVKVVIRHYKFSKFCIIKLLNL